MHARRGNRILLQMVLSHHVDAGNWHQEPLKEQPVLKQSLQPPDSLFFSLMYSETTKERKGVLGMIEEGYRGVGSSLYWDEMGRLRAWVEAATWTWRHYWDHSRRNLCHLWSFRTDMEVQAGSFLQAKHLVNRQSKVMIEPTKVGVMANFGCQLETLPWQGNLSWKMSPSEWPMDMSVG